YKAKTAKVNSIKPHAKLDFIVSRTLAKMLKIINPPLYEEQKKFTELFLQKGVPVNSKYGDLAFTEMGIQLLLTDIIAVKELYFIPNITDSKSMIDRLNTWFREKKNDGPFVIAAVNYPRWIDPPPPQIPEIPQIKCPSKKQGEPDFVHWVVIVRKINNTGFHNNIDIWTWGKMLESRQLIKYTGGQNPDLTSGYLYSIILGCLKPE
ncbi:hypothetical protein, partial [Desulfobotulus mexicanus]